MKRHGLRTWLWLAMTLGGATLFQYACTGVGGGGYYGWQRFVSNGVLGAVNWCYVLDCQSGFFGGIINPCTDPSLGPWLLDCPDAGAGNGEAEQQA